MGNENSFWSLFHVLMEFFFRLHFWCLLYYPLNYLRTLILSSMEISFVDIWYQSQSTQQMFLKGTKPLLESVKVNLFTTCSSIYDHNRMIARKICRSNKELVVTIKLHATKDFIFLRKLKGAIFSRKKITREV